MTYYDHTAAWQRMRNLVLCLRCGEFPGVGCSCPPKGFRGRLRALVTRWTRSRRRTANRLRKQVAALTAEVTALESLLKAEQRRRLRAEANNAAERIAKQQLLDTMTPGRRRGRA